MNKKKYTWIIGGLIAMIPLLMTIALKWVMDTLPDESFRDGVLFFVGLALFLTYIFGHFIFAGASCALLYHYVPAGDRLCSIRHFFISSTYEPTTLGFVIFLGIYFIIGSIIGYSISKSNYV